MLRDQFPTDTLCVPYGSPHLPVVINYCFSYAIYFCFGTPPYFIGTTGIWKANKGMIIDYR